MTTLCILAFLHKGCKSIMVFLKKYPRSQKYYPLIQSDLMKKTQINIL